MKNKKYVGDLRIGAFADWPVLPYGLNLEKTSELEQSVIASKDKPKALKRSGKLFVDKRGSKYKA